MRYMVPPFLVCFALMGCSGKSDDDSGSEGDTGVVSSDAPACAMRDDEGLQMVPGNTPDTTAPAIQTFDSPYTIQLASNQGGWVRLVVPDAGAYTLHTGFSGVLYGLWDETGEYPMRRERPSEVCPDTIPAVYTFETTGPATLYMQMGPLTSLFFWVYFQQES